MKNLENEQSWMTRTHTPISRHYKAAIIIFSTGLIIYGLME